MAMEMLEPVLVFGVQHDQSTAQNKYSRNANGIVIKLNTLIGEKNTYPQWLMLKNVNYVGN